MIDDGVDLDLRAVCQNIAEAEVITVYFPLIGRTLLVDARRAAGVSTMVRVVPMARDTGERLRSLRRLRPMLPRPESITMIPWQMRVQAVIPTGVWECLLRRIDDHPALFNDDGAIVEIARRPRGDARVTVTRDESAFAVPYTRQRP